MSVWRTIGTGGNVADGKRVRVSQCLRVLQRRERVGGLAGLRHDDDQRVILRHAVAVAVFAGNLDGAGYSRQRLDPLLGDQAGVITRAARQNQY
jgi:hypothetical protein